MTHNTFRDLQNHPISTNIGLGLFTFIVTTTEEPPPRYTDDGHQFINGSIIPNGADFCLAQTCHVHV